jgi:hypothetical protein
MERCAKKCAKKKKKAVERKKKGLDRASIVRDGRLTLVSRSIGGAFPRMTDVRRGALRAFDRPVWRKPMAFAADAEIPGPMGLLSFPIELMTLRKT